MCCDHSMNSLCREEGESARDYLTKVLTAMNNGERISSVEGTVNCVMVRVAEEDVRAAETAPPRCQWPDTEEP